LTPFDPSKPDESNDLSKNGTINVYCKKCFQETSLLDFSRNEDEYKAESSTKSPITFVMVHGGGGSRGMFSPHAKLLAKRGYRSILLDLPGHGTRVDTPLTLDSCVETVKSVLDKYELKGATTIYVGGSLGAYTGFYTLDKLKDRFCGAVQIDCGQNVGPGASLKARVGMWFLKKVAHNMSNQGLMGAMMDIAKKSPADFKLVEASFGNGMFFEQGVEQTECLRAVAPADFIPGYDFPVLYFNGSEDYRDSEDKWLSLCKDQERSSLKVYEGGDHFFCHDSRFVDDMMEKIDVFAKSVGG
jgi:pimeloyl-ACP methyl ester carboxylesterase